LQIEQVDENIEYLGQLIASIQSVAPHVGRQETLLPPLHDILQLLNACFEKVNNEACRIGALNKKLKVPEAKSFLDITQVLSLIKVHYEVNSS
jgi:hypothetical protein